MGYGWNYATRRTVVLVAGVHTTGRGLRPAEQTDRKKPATIVSLETS